MTTGNELNRDMTFSEIAREIEQNGYSALTDAEINLYIETIIQLAVQNTQSEVELQAQEATHSETLQYIIEQAENTRRLLELKLAEIEANIGDGNE